MAFDMYIMSNITVEATTHKTFVVKADTERFGEQEIMYESWNLDDCNAYVKEAVLLSVNTDTLRLLGMTEDNTIDGLNDVQVAELEEIASDIRGTVEEFCEDGENDRYSIEQFLHDRHAFNAAEYDLSDVLDDVIDRAIGEYLLF